MNEGVSDSEAESLSRPSEVSLGRGLYIALQLALERSGRLCHLVDYMRYMAARHPRESIRLFGPLVETRGRSRDMPDEDFVMGTAVHLIARLALGGGCPEFSRLFERIVNDDSYNRDVKWRIAYSCRGVLPHGGAPAGRIVGAYSRLLDSDDADVRGWAEYFLFATLAKGGAHLAHCIKPALEKASRLAYRPPYNPSMVPYLARFWTELPRESVECLGRLCRRNLDTMLLLDDGASALDMMEEMFESRLLDTKSKRDLHKTLMLFVDADLDRAREVLATARLHV